MVRLKTFGGVVVEGPEGPLTGAVSQRRRLAVLVLIAAGGNGISRDRLISLLWPESDEERARHALAQLLYAVRRELGAEAVTGSATALRLDPDAVSSDIQDFHAALDRGDDAAAAALYAGPFLDGFHLSGCPEFERWLDEQRDRYAQLTRAAVERLAARAEAAGDRADAVRWLRALVALDPYDPRPTVALMSALAAAGDRPGALRHAKVHETLVRDQLGVPPDASVLALAEALAADPGPREAPLPAAHERPVAAAPGATGSTAAVPAMAHAPHGAEAAALDEKDSAPAARPDASPVPSTSAAAAPGPQVAPQRAPVRPSRRRFTAVAAAAAVFITVAAFLSVRAGATGAMEEGDRQDWVIIAGTENETGEAVFDRTVPFALAAGVGQASKLYVVPPERIGQALVRMRRPRADSALDEALAREIARREGARFVVVPGVRPITGGYELSARVIEPASGAVLSLTAVNAPDQTAVMDALDKLSRRVRRELGESALRVATRTTRLPLVTTGSLAALEKYASGSRAFDLGRLREAETLWREAVELDSTFAVAHAARGILAYWVNDAVEGEAHFARALPLAEALPDRERTLLRARVESWRGNREASVDILRAYLVEHPNDINALGQIAYDYLRLDRHEEAADVYRRLLRLDSTNHSTLINLATVEKGLGAYESALAHYRRAFELVPSVETENSNLNQEYGSAYVQMGMRDSAEAVFSRMLPGPRPVRARGLRSLAFLAMDESRYEDAVQLLQEAVSLTGADRAWTSEIRNRLLLSTALAQTGAVARAHAQLDSAYARAVSFDADPILAYWLGKALVRTGDVERPAALLAGVDARRHPDNVPARAAADALRGEILVARGDPGAALAHLEHALRDDSSKITLESLAHGVAAAGDYQRAVALYEELARGTAFGHEAQEAHRMALFWLGRYADEAGEDEFAARTLTRFLESWGGADAALPVLVEARERLVRLSGSRR